MPIIGIFAGTSARGFGGLGASVIIVPSTLTVDYLVVAGGGGGGTRRGGGGGAGGYRTSIGGTALTMALNTSFTATVGAGGAGSNQSPNAYGTKEVTLYFQL
jgi:hypothetical protein